MQFSARTFERGRIRLEVIREEHREAFREATRNDEATWPLLARRWEGDGFDVEWERVLSERRVGRMIPYMIMADGICGGITAYIDPNVRNASVEIGATYYRPALRGTLINPTAKYLLLKHAFSVGVRRVQLKVDASNVRSRAAVLKLGAVFEGIRRQDLQTWSGRIRNTALYSILAEEWPDVQAKLAARLGGEGVDG